MRHLTPIAHIQEEVAHYYHLPRRVMTETDCARSIVRPRQVAMLMAFEFVGQNKSEIGRRFKRHPSTVLHGIRLIERLIEADPETAADIARLRRRLAQ